MKEKRTLNNKKAKPNIRIIIFIIFLIFFSILSVTMAKYVLKIEDIHQIESSPFYFNSDIAPNKISNYYEKNWDGEENLEINFSINNYENLNLVTKENITYEIEIEKIDDANNEITAQIYENNKNITGEQTLTGGAFETKNYILKIKKNSTITADEFNLKLKINSLTPYKEEIISNIKINMSKGDNTISSLITDNGEYVILKIQTNDYVSSKTITFDNSKLVLDKANNLLNNVNITTNSFIIPKDNFEENMNYEVVFVKIDNNTEIKLGTDITIN